MIVPDETFLERTREGFAENEDTLAALRESGKARLKANLAATTYPFNAIPSEKIKGLDFGARSIKIMPDGPADGMDIAK